MRSAAPSTEPSTTRWSSRRTSTGSTSTDRPTRWRDGEGATARLTEALADDRSPVDAPLTLAPRLVELCFQAAGLRDAARKDLLALPLSVGRLRVLLDPATATGRLVAHAEERDGRVDAVVVDDEGRVVVGLDAYRTVALPGGIPDDVRVCLRAAFGSETPR